MDSRITWLKGDVLQPLEGCRLEGRIDAILSNPPYVTEAEWPALQEEVRLFEPRQALVAGPKGTEFHERLLKDAIPFLKPGGWLIMELGRGQSQGLIQVVDAMASSYRSTEVVFDHAGIDRVLIVQRAG
jgi:release factor glutamine methyltransferase